MSMAGNPRVQSWMRALWLQFLAAMAFGGVSFLSLNLAGLMERHVSAVWPASGLAMAILCFCGRRFWVAIFLGATLSNWSTSWLEFPELPLWRMTVPALGIASGAVLESITAAWFLKHRAGGQDFCLSAAHATAFVLLVSLVSAFISALIGPTALWCAETISPESWGMVALTWFVGDATGILVFGDALVFPWRSIDFASFLGRWLEIFFLFSSLALVGGTMTGIYQSPLMNEWPRAYMILPVILLAVFRFNHAGTLASTSRSVLGTASSQSVGLTVSHSFGQWTATSNNPWLTVTSPTGTATGSGTNSFSVAANNGPARSGTLTIAGRISTVHQDAVPFSIVASQGANGTISPAGSLDVTYGSNATYIIDASPGFYLDTLIVDGTSVSPVYSYTFTNVTSNHTIAATFGAQEPVGSILDSGPGALREILTKAESGSTITFDPALSGRTITLSSELTIDRNLTIDASGLANGVAISGNNATRVFNIQAISNVTMRSLTIVHGQALHGADGINYESGLNGSGGGGILNDGTLSLIPSTVANNSSGRGGQGTSGISGRNGGHAGNGGGIYNTGSLTITSCTISSNSVNVRGLGG